MSQATNSIGRYIDEGTFTYVGRQASSEIGDAVFDNIGKKLTYGFFWKNPPTIGGSDWIKDVYVALPELIYEGLKKKNIVHLRPEWLENESLQEFSDVILSLQSYDPKALGEVKILIALPHESILKQFSFSWEEVINGILQKNTHIAAKYHPRDQHRDLLNLTSKQNLLEIPRKINFETLIPHLPEGCVIIGDFSSVLINAKWLKPSLSIKAVVDERSLLAKRFKSFYKSLGIDLCKLQDLQE